MRRSIEAKLLRVAVVAGGLFVVLLLVVGGAALLGAPDQLIAVLPVLTVAFATAMLRRLKSSIDSFVERLTHYHEITPYSVLANAAERLQSRSLDEALPGLARVLVEGTSASRAAVWLVVGERLVAAASHASSVEPRRPDTADNLAVLVARSGDGHVVPVLEGNELRAALTIDKPGMPITTGDRALMQDVANGAALLLRTVALNAELSERVRRADQLADELDASRQRLTRAREVEQRRLLAELSRATSGRLVALRGYVLAARADLDDPGAHERRASVALTGARSEIDDLLDRFRVIARGVYPAVLRGQGPGAALEELTADLSRPVRLTGDADVRLAWEIESAIYHVTAAALNVLAATAAEKEIVVHMTQGEGRVTVVVADPVPTVTVDELRAVLTDDAERLAALGGSLECVQVQPAEPDESSAPVLRLLAWLPNRLDAFAGSDAAAETMS